MLWPPNHPTDRINSPEIVYIRKFATEPKILSWQPGGEPYWPTELAAIIRALDAEEQQVSTEHSAIMARLQTLNTPSPDVWSFWDFFYFSVITQGTVGYGDIIPNRTLVRSIVVAQLLLGYLVLVVVVNWVATAGHKPNSGETSGV
jgi:hypothetical protein